MSPWQIVYIILSLLSFGIFVLTLLRNFNESNYVDSDAIPFLLLLSCFGPISLVVALIWMFWVKAKVKKKISS